MKLTTNTFIIAACVLLLAGLSNSFAASGAKIDLSRIIDKAAAEGILGVKVKEATPRNIEGSDGYYSKCNYYSITPGKTLLLRLYQLAVGRDPQQQLNVLMKNTPALKEVSGIGDKAFVTDGSASALPSDALMFYVVKGNSILTVGLSGNETDATGLERAKDVAQKILAQL